MKEIKNPIPYPNYEVDFGNDSARMTFKAMNGLNEETRVLEYRQSDSPQFSTQKLTTISKHGHITLKNGVVKNCKDLSIWQSEFKSNPGKTRTFAIRLVDEQARVVIQWTLTNAFPIKVIAPDLEAGGNEVPIDSLEIGYDQIITSVGNNKS
ncbi:MAG: phage tail protein [Saprospiraceae bacterium]|nr:phage tail protein [Saprospiraceae bacterium]HMW40102.1 phage tail protein [Saprospiraceae bacterium]HMX88881.1 phage tail protein [Saprospiraceae bacterium]HMZ40990.1 phage tail protein [Saprospiraceae bacterium]HNA64383.1 phage tail protein [Saprospiraceae bacterium]